MLHHQFLMRRKKLISDKFGLVFKNSKAGGNKSLYNENFKKNIGNNINKNRNSFSEKLPNFFLYN